MAFSGAIKLTDLNDYITPSQACIKPIETKHTLSRANSAQIHIGDDGGVYEISDGKQSQLQKAEISLNDCLACSGCITSAESVLITSQSHDEVISVIENNKRWKTSEQEGSPKYLVMSISPQSVVSLTTFLSFGHENSISSESILRRLTHVAKDVLGFNRVFDTTFAREIALRETGKEFSQRWDKKAGTISSDPAASSSATPLPLLASACPGWICYAEKTHAEMLPYISTVKSPQQIMGSLVKEGLGSQLGLKPSEIYHVSVMPCYDKKLEASRPDFSDNDVREVDCVLTTHELHLIMTHYAINLIKAPEGQLDTEFPPLLSHPGSGSGSYLHAAMRHILLEKFANLAGQMDAPNLSAVVSENIQELTSSQLKVKTHRSADFTEYTITEDEYSKPLLRFATCYGFRNLQNLVRKVKKGGAGSGRKVGAISRRRGSEDVNSPTTASDAWDFVEVMACPSGCINGGGQMQPPKQKESDDMDIDGSISTTLSSREWLELVSRAYDSYGVKENHRDVISRRSDVHEALSFVENTLVNAALISSNRIISDELRKSLWHKWTRTEYHAVVSMEKYNPLGVKW